MLFRSLTLSGLLALALALLALTLTFFAGLLSSGIALRGVRADTGFRECTATATATFVKCPIDPSANMFKGTDEWLGKSAVVLIPE